MNILSLFDGMSCGQIAINRLGIKYDNYFASEIDKYAIQVTKANYPDTKHIGSVVDVKGENLPKIDLLIGGSPCQSFSFCGKKNGMSTACSQEILTLEHYLELKADGFEFDGQSYLFWEYMRLLKETKPKYFLLENVLMGQKWQKILSQTIGIDPIKINSSLLSGQSRNRLYWTNIGTTNNNLFGIDQVGIIQPQDKGILLRDILQQNVSDKYFINQLNKNYSFKPMRLKKKFTQLDSKDKSLCLCHANSLSNWIGDFVSESFVSSSKPIQENKSAYYIDGKSTTLDLESEIKNLYEGVKIRRLTPIECERLQTVPDNYTNHVSDVQRYRMLGNGWTVDVIVHILKHMEL